MRHKILDLLVARPREFVSGEQISQELNLTRAAIWKQIKGLKEAGYEIEAQTKNGYRLLATPLALDAWAVAQELKTERLGRELYLYEEISSTNEKAKELARQGAAHGAVVIGRRQTAGHGRMQRLWESPPGGLWMSVVLRPNLSLADASKLTLVTSVAVVGALREMGELKPGIKWPNDVIFEGKKLAGILAEVVGEWTTIQTMVLGIGVNANLERKDLSPELSAGSLQELLGCPLDLNKLAAGILEKLEEGLNIFERDGFAPLRELWLERALGIGRECAIEKGGQVYRGIMRGIAADGELVVEVDGQDHKFAAGEVRLRAVNGEYF
ncbi:biotin--[acetyl-CoA-carboxylase] ligase [Paradesulfitobacterium aromaticivorans]